MEGAAASSVRVPAAATAGPALAPSVAQSPGQGAAQGAGRLWGQVRDEEGNGVPGVLIGFWPEVSELRVLDAGAIGASAPSLDQLASETRARAAAWIAAQGQTVEVTTDAEGSYSVEGVAEQRWQASGYRSGLVVAPVRGSSDTITPGVAYDFIARKRIEVELRLVGETGEPLESGVIVARGWNVGSRGMRVLRWSAEAPAIPLEAGKWRLEAFSGNVRERASQRGRFDADFASESYDLETPLLAGEPPIELTLAPPTSLHGSLVVGDPAVGHSQFTVKLARYVGADKPSMDSSNRQVLSRQLSSGGSFTFQDLEPGRYLVTLQPGFRGTVLYEETVDLERGRNEHVVDLPQLDRSQFVWLRCLDPGGEPVEASSVSIRVDTKGGGAWSGPVQTIPLTTGGQLVELPDYVAETERKGSTVAGIQLTVKHSRYSDVLVSIDGGERQAEARFEGSGELTVTVTGIPPGAHQGLRLHLQPAGAKGRSVAGRGVIPDDDGVVHWKRAQLGASELLLMQDSSPESSFGPMAVIHRQELVVAAGSSSVSMPYPELYDLEIYVPNGRVREMIRVLALPHDREGIISNTPRAILGEDLRVRVSGLPAGQYRISRGPTSMTVTVPCDPVTLQR